MHTCDKKQTIKKHTHTPKKSPQNKKKPTTKQSEPHLLTSTIT